MADETGRGLDRRIVSPTQEPADLPGWADHWERGSDPWHASAFVGTPAEGMFEDGEPIKTGWYAIDWCGNVVGFVADGELVDPPSHKAAGSLVNRVYLRLPAYDAGLLGQGEAHNGE